MIVSNGDDLLRMLMPAVRPVPIPPGSASVPQNLPIESRSFDLLLDDARQVDPVAATDGKRDGGTQVRATGNTSPDDAPPAIARLTGIDSIHNASLRRIIADAADGR